jgi:ABC-type polysaccharide/polyol phosphate transport system ATPase subunit
MREVPGQLTLKSAFVDSFRRRSGRGLDGYQALRDIDLCVMQGRSLGIIGQNGSGKSTLLKIIGKIYRPDAGTVEVQGRLAALIELGAGFHHEFTGPARTYSSGMYVRLGFAVAAHLDPDVMLIDEVLAVGDEAFARKCGERMADFRDRGKTMVLVTHDVTLVERWCDEAIWLDHGVIRAAGTPGAVIEAYHRVLAERETARLEAEGSARAGPVLPNGSPQRTSTPA